MKKLILTILVGLLLMPCFAHAVGTVTQALTGDMDSQTRYISVYRLTFTVTADASAGTVPATAINAANLAKLVGWYLYQVQTKPGTTNPTTLYDITLTDANGYDVAGGLLADRSASAVQTVLISPSTGYPIVTSGGLTLNIANNSVNSAGITVILTFIK